MMVIRRMAERIIGMDPRDVGPIGAKLFVATQMSQGGVIAQAIAALENACLDIKGKAAGLPVYDLFGGAHRKRLPAYWSHCGSYRVRSAELFEKVNNTPPIRSLDDIKKLGQEVVSKGFKALKTNLLCSTGQAEAIPAPPSLAARDIRTQPLVTQYSERHRRPGGGVSRGYRPGCGALFDLNFHYKPEGFRRIAKAVEPQRLTWLEINFSSLSGSPSCASTQRRRSGRLRRSMAAGR